MKYCHFRQWSLLFFLMLFIHFAWSQNATQKIQLLDQETALPISAATFTYDEQSGVSDTEGFISLTYQPGAELWISHTAYGDWTLSEEELSQSFAEGKIFKRERIINFQPLTVVALRPKKSETQSVDLDNQSRLAHDAATILNQIPGLSSIRKGGAYGFDPVMRGFKYDQLNIVIDGAQCATAACPNRMDPPSSQVAPNMMERVEVLKGPHSFRYGTALGGTINFVSASPVFSESGETLGRISSNYESNGDIFRSEGMVGYRAKKIELGIFGSWSDGDDYEDGEGQLVQSDFKRGSIGANLAFKLDKNQTLRLSTTRNIARDADFPALAMDLRKDDTWLFNATHQLNLNQGNLKAWNTTAYATKVDHLMDNLLKNIDPRMVNASTSAETQTYGGRTEGTFIFNQNRLYLGADLKVEQAEGERERAFLMGPNAGNTVFDNIWQKGKIQRSSIFAEYHLKSSFARFVFSGRFEYNQAKVEDVAPEFKEVYSDPEVNQFNPSFSVGGIKQLGNNPALGLWLGRSQRSAGLTERFINYLPVGLDPFEMIGNPNLDPEINNQMDLTFSFQSENTELELGTFVGILQDFISSQIDTTLSPRLPMSPGVRQFINIDQALMTGFEFSWKQQLVQGLQQQFVMSYTYGQNLDLDAPLPEIAPLDMSYNLTGNYFQDKFQPGLTLRYVMQQDRIATEFGETETPDFFLIDLNARYQILESLSITAGVQNLLDTFIMNT